MKVKENEKVGLKLNNQQTKIMVSGPITSWQIDGETVETVYSFCKTLLSFALLHSVLQGQICLSLQMFLTSYFCIPVPYNKKDTFLGC